MGEYVIVECKETAGFVAWGTQAGHGTWAPILRTNETRRRNGEIRKVIAYRVAVPGYAFVPTAALGGVLLDVPSRFGLRVLRNERGLPHVCPTEELAAMQRALNDEYQAAQPGKRPHRFEPGARVRVSRPPFAGYEGTVVADKRSGVRCAFGLRYLTLPASFLELV